MPIAQSAGWFAKPGPTLLHPASNAMATELAIIRRALDIVSEQRGQAIRDAGHTARRPADIRDDFGNRYGTWQCQGEVRHLVAQRLVDMSHLLGGLQSASRDFC